MRYTIVVLVCLSTMTAIYQGLVTQKVINIKDRNYFLSNSSSIVKQIDLYIEKFIIPVNMLTLDVKLAEDIASCDYMDMFSNTGSYNRIQSILDGVILEHDMVLNFGIGVIAEDAVYVQNGLRFGSAQDYSLKESIIFMAVTENEMVISKPYIDANTGNMCISISSPITYENKTVGLVVLDLSLEAFSTVLQENAFDKTSSAMILSQENDIMAFEDTSFIGQN